MTHYYVESCNHCGKLNSVCGGDPTDMTGFDPTGFRCWSCGGTTMYDDGEGEYGIDEGKPTTEDAVDAERKRCADALRRHWPSDLERYNYTEGADGGDVVLYARYQMEKALADIEGGVK